MTKLIKIVLYIPAPQNNFIPAFFIITIQIYYFNLSANTFLNLSTFGRTTEAQ